MSVIKQKLTFFLSFLTVFVFVSEAASYRDMGASVKFLVGEVKVRRAKDNTKKWQDVKIGMRLSSGDALRTMVESRVEITTSEGSVLKIEENSMVELTKLLQDRRTKARETKVRMKNGNIWANVKKFTSKRSDFVFETPTATAAIRGTKLSLSASRNRTRLKVYEGEVDFNGVSVKTDQMADAVPGKPVVPKKIEETADTASSDTASADTTVTDTAASDSASEEIQLNLNIPDIVPTPRVPVAGTVTPGANVIIAGVPANVSESGEVKGIYMIPSNEPGKYSFDIKAVLGDITTSTIVSVEMAPDSAAGEVFLEVSVPDEVFETAFEIRGRTVPGAVVTVNGASREAPDGNFVFNINLGDNPEPGQYKVAVKTVAGDKTASSEYFVTYSEPPTGDDKCNCANLSGTPSVVLTAPRSGAVVQSTTIEVRGRVTGLSGINYECVNVMVGPLSTVPASDGSFSLQFAIDDSPDPQSIGVMAEVCGKSAVSPEITITYEDPTADEEKYLNDLEVDTEPASIEIRGKTNCKNVKIDGMPVNINNGMFVFRISPVNDVVNTSYFSEPVLNVSADCGLTEIVDHGWIPAMDDKAVNTRPPVIKTVFRQGDDLIVEVTDLSLAPGVREELRCVVRGDDEQEIVRSIQDRGSVRLSFPLEEGLEKEYDIRVTDLAGNSDERKSQPFTYNSSTPRIAVSRPATNPLIIKRPPSPPAGGIEYELRFYVQGLYDDNPDFIKRVRVILNGDIVLDENSPNTVDFSVYLDGLEYGKSNPNTIQIQVDLNGEQVVRPETIRLIYR